MHFISLCPTPIEPAGHGEIYHTCLKKAVEKLNFHHKIYVHADSQTKNFGKRYFQKKNPFRRYLEFKQLFKKRLVCPDIFFTEAFTSKDLIALLFATFFHMGKQSQLWVLFRYGLDQLPLHGKLHALLLKLFNAKMSSRLIFLTDSEKIQASYEAYFKCNMTLLPILHVDFCPKPFSGRKTHPYMCWWPGKPKMAKGKHEILKLLSMNDPQNRHFQVILSEEVSLPQKAYVNVQVVESYLIRERYLSVLEQSHLILLPYDPEVYAAGTSGIFVESIVAGKIPLVKEGSWLAFQLKKFDLHELIIDWNSSNLFTQILSLLENPNVIEKLKYMQEAYIRYHSIDSFAAEIKKLLLKKSKNL